MKFLDRRFKADKKQVKVKTIWARQNAILRMAHLGLKNAQIAANLGVTPQNVSDVRNSKLGQDKLATLRALSDAGAIDEKQRILEVVPAAMDLLEDIINGEGDGKGASLAMRAKYADKHLGRAGLGEIKKVAALSGRLTRDDLERIKARAQQEQTLTAEYTNVGAEE